MKLYCAGRALKIDCPPQEVAGYYPVTMEQWQTGTLMKNQPVWRKNFFRKYPSSRTFYAQAPRELRVDPVFCPWRRRRTWDDFRDRQKTNPQWLNYPLLDAPDENEEPSEGYMVRVG